jgi:L-asparaginase II
MPTTLLQPQQACLPVLNVWRGPVLECVHFGAITVVDPNGKLRYHYGDPQLVTYLRSTAKPFQALPFVEAGGVEKFNLTEKELAILCASHDGTDEHVATLQGIQKKVGILESELQCGTHPPFSKPTQKQLALAGEEPTQNRHNCSGKHTGMLSFATLLGADKKTYLEVNHPVQHAILKTFSEMVDVPLDEIPLGIDGCSAPVFAAPLLNSALGFARLADPRNLSEKRGEACRKITRAMMAHPEMIAGPGDFDTTLMQVGAGKIFAKSGAEGFLGIGLLPGATGAGSQALGIAIKIMDGDIGSTFRPEAKTNEGRARPIVALEVLRQLGALDADQLKEMASFDARPQHNWRHLEVGRFEPAFTLSKDGG